MMKLILTICLAMLTTSLVMGQKIGKIKDMVKEQKWEQAKEGIEKHLSEPKNAAKAEGWFVKSQVYMGIAYDSVLSTTMQEDPKDIAVEAYKKYLELDPKAIEGTLYQHAPLFEAASEYSNSAIIAFNNKEYEKALSNFQKQKEVQEYLVSKKFSYNGYEFPVLDTNLHINIGLSYTNMGNHEMAAKYYGRLMEEKIKNDNFLDLYLVVVDYYDRKGDEANTEKYLAIGKELYPEEEFWCEVGLASSRDNPAKLFQAYEKLIASGCDKYGTLYGYGVDLYNYANFSDEVPADAQEKRNKLIEILKIAIAKEPNTPEANMLLARQYLIYVSELNDELDKVKGADASAKRAEFNKKIQENYDLAYPYLDKLYNLYSAKSDISNAEKGQFKLVASLLQEYWELKDNDDKAQVYKDKVRSL